MSTKLMFKPCIVVLSGPPLHGKSTIARELHRVSNFVFLDVDGMKEEYPQASTEERYGLMTEHADRYLPDTPVVFAATFSKGVFKAPLKALIERYPAIPSLIFSLAVPSRDEIASRIQTRLAAGDPLLSIKTVEKYDWALTLVEPWWEGVTPIALNAQQEMGGTLRELLDHLAAHGLRA
jgi:hypothetical protein